MCQAEAFDLALESFRNTHNGQWPNPGDETRSVKNDPAYGYQHYLTDGYTDHDSH